MIRQTACVIVFVCWASVAAAAGHGDDTVTTAPIAATETHRLLVPVTWLPAPARAPRNVQRPAALPVLYASLAAFQMFDGYSTTRALAQGATEANLVKRHVVRRPVVFWSVKAAMAAAPMLTAERLWKKNKTRTIVFMAATNGIMAVVAAHNARVLNRQR